MPEFRKSAGVRAGTGATLLVAIALAVGACAGAGASSLPTIGNIPTVPASGSACLDAATLSIIDQLKASGADVPTILAANKDKLTSGLNQFQPTDPAVKSWRDTLVAAIGSNDAALVATQVAIVSSGQVTIPPC
jgi:hypothetical protein